MHIKDLSTVMQEMQKLNMVRGIKDNVTDSMTNKTHLDLQLDFHTLDNTLISEKGYERLMNVILDELNDRENEIKKALKNLGVKT